MVPPNSTGSLTRIIWARSAPVRSAIVRAYLVTTATEQHTQSVRSIPRNHIVLGEIVCVLTRWKRASGAIFLGGPQHADR